MSWQSQILKPIHPNITSFLDARGVNHGRIPWVKMDSNAVVNGSHTLRKKWSLGSTERGQETTFSGAWIQSITCTPKGILGSLREARVQIKVLGRDTFLEIEQLFLVPGISVVLQWGWAGISPLNIENYSNMESLQRDMIKRSLGVKTDEEFFANTRTETNTTAGQYDGLVGVITNFSWKPVGTTGFECEVTLASPNGIMASQPSQTQKFNIRVDRTLRGTVGGSGESKIGTTETLHLTDVESVMYALQYPGSIQKRSVTVPIAADFDNSSQEFSTYEFKYSEGFEQIKQRIACDLSGESYYQINPTGQQTQPDLGYYVFRAGPEYVGPTIGSDTIIERGIRTNNFAWTMPVRYQKNVSNYAETDQWIYLTYVSWRFIEDFICSRLISNHYQNNVATTVASLDIESKSADSRYWAVASSRKIRNLPELRSADPTVCLLPGQIYSNPTSLDMENSIPTDHRAILSEVSRQGIFPFPGGTSFQSINDPAIFSTDGSHEFGYLRNILINAEVVSTAYKETNTLSDFLKAILDRVSTACGNIWSFHVVANSNRPQLLEIIDEKTVDKKQDTHYRFNLGNVTTKVKSFEVNTKLPTQAAALAFIGARSSAAPQKENSVYASDSVAFLGYANGVKDRFSVNQPKTETIELTATVNPPTPLEDSSDLSEDERIELFQDRAEADLYVDLPPRERWLNSYANLLMRNFSTPEQRSHATDALKNFLVMDVERESFIDDSRGPTYLLPIDLPFTLDGVSGIFMGNSFITNTFSSGGPIPDRYKDRVVFQITGITHTISNNQWNTEINGMMRLMDIRKNLSDTKQVRPRQEPFVPGFSPNTSLSSAIGLNNAATNLTSQASIEALHPSIQDKVRRILSRLEAQGWQPIIASAFRSLSEQRKKVEAGQSEVLLGKHNNVIGTSENPLRAALALDIVDRRYSWGNGRGDDAFANAAKFFIALAKEARKEGFGWGGDWTARTKGTGSEWSRYLKSNWSEPVSGLLAQQIIPAGSFRETGWPFTAPRMGWDPAHIEIYQGAVGTTPAAASLYADVPSWAEAKRLSSQIYGLDI